MANPRLMSDSDGFDVNNPFGLPRMSEELQSLDLVLVYFTVSCRPSPAGDGRSLAPSWGVAARPGNLAVGADAGPPVTLDFNLFGAVKLASRSQAVVSAES